MSDGDPRTQILRLEDEIEELTEVLERCRKIILISKIAVAAGGIWLLTLSSGIIRFDPVAMIGAIAVVIGGTVGVRTTANDVIIAAMTSIPQLALQRMTRLDPSCYRQADPV
jgi:hypothetical protein